MTKSVHVSTRSYSNCALPEGLAVRVCVLEAHLLQFTAAVELIVTRVSLLSQVLHVNPDEHLPQLDEITVILIFHCETHGNPEEATSEQQARERSRRSKAESLDLSFLGYSFCYSFFLRLLPRASTAVCTSDVMWLVYWFCCVVV